MILCKVETFAWDTLILTEKFGSEINPKPENVVCKLGEIYNVNVMKHNLFKP